MIPLKEWTNGTPENNYQDGTQLDAADFESWNKELVAVLAAAGVAPDAAKFDQLVSAVQVIQRNQIANAVTTAGAAPAFTLTPGLPLTAYAPDKRFRVKFHAATAVAATLNVSGLGGKPLKQYDNTGAKVNAVIAAGQLADVEFDGVDFVILDPLPPATGVKGDDMASAATVNVGAATGDYVTITGAIAITSFGVAPAGTKRTVVFSASLTLTHSANLLLNANGANIITAANDVAEFRSEGGGVWRCADYTRADGKPLSGSGGTNGMGTRYISTSSPTGGVDGDIWYKV